MTNYLTKLQKDIDDSIIKTNDLKELKLKFEGVRYILSNNNINEECYSLSRGSVKVDEHNPYNDATDYVIYVEIEDKHFESDKFPKDFTFTDEYDNHIKDLRRQILSALKKELGSNSAWEEDDVFAVVSYSSVNNI